MKKHVNPRYRFFFLLIISLNFVFPLTLISKDTEDPYIQTRNNILNFGQIYQAITERYVEDVDPDKFIRAGINGMLDKLDPYTVYLEEEGKEELQIMTRGKYYGVGMKIQLRNGWATVAEEPFANTPASRAGIREGDQIIEIDGQSTKDAPLDETAQRLRGAKKGSEVRIKIQRVGEENPLDFTLIRDEIVISDIEYVGFVEPGIGLIKLSRFNRGAGDQVREAVETLMDQGLDGLIFDLRGNPGGLLDAAVEVAENFVSKGQMIVYTEGRNGQNRTEYHSTVDPILGSTPLAILVDGYSASASEIVAGAIQDLDRGVIIGSETFGKGLVQTVVPLDRRGETQIKITTAKYFMPSGRLIQRPDVFDMGPGSVFKASADTEAANAHTSKETKTNEKEKKYTTKNNRPVNGGGGITPDVTVENFDLNRYEIELIRQSMFFNFSLNYVAEHHALDKDFVVTQEILDEFNKFVESKNFNYKPTGSEEVEKLAEIAKQNGCYESIKPQLDAILAQFEQVKQRERQSSTDHIKLFLKREIAGKVFGRDAYIETMFDSDLPLKRSIEVLKNPKEYNDILHVQLADADKGSSEK
jgi:carboxyl-terminal processing protease